MKVYIRNSSIKRRRLTGFRNKKATRHGRKALNNQRNIAAGKPKRNKCLRAKLNKRRQQKRDS